MQRKGEAAQAELCGAVEGVDGDMGSHGGHGDDDALAPLQHAWQHCMRQEDGAEQIYIDYVLDLLSRAVLKRLPPGHTRVVHQHVHLPEHLQLAFRQALYLRYICHVRGDGYVMLAPPLTALAFT